MEFFRNDQVSLGFGFFVISDVLDDMGRQVAGEVIVDAGGIIPYRMRLNECDANGKVIDNNFSQNVLDMEIAYENSFPTQDVYGTPVPTAWGLILDSEHNGHKMLENPDLNIRIG